jgi:hypothetical protein
MVKVAKLGCRICEVPISYHGNTYAEGKEIGWRTAWWPSSILSVSVCPTEIDRAPSYLPRTGALTRPPDVDPALPYERITDSSRGLLSLFQSYPFQNYSIV